jgi:hypothetical protein
MQQIPLNVPSIPPAEKSDGANIAGLEDARKELSDAQYLIAETSKDYSRALTVVRRLSGNDKESLRQRGFDFDRLLDAQAGLLSASKLVTRQLSTFNALVGVTR